jgi:hypothetical protein
LAAVRSPILSDVSKGTRVPLRNKLSRLNHAMVAMYLRVIVAANVSSRDCKVPSVQVDAEHAVAWALAERGAPRGLHRLLKPSSSRPYRGWVARCKTSSSQVANLALAHLRLLVGAAAQVAEARTGFLDAQDER